jgi:hypothetical protein
VRHPRLIVVAFDEWLTNQLTEFVREHRWLHKEVRQFPAGLALLRDAARPTVLLLQFDPRTENIAAPLTFVTAVQHVAPDTAIVAISDVKLPEDDRATWTATLFDLGVRAVLFPPLSRPVLEDLVGGLMTAVIRRSQPPVETLPVEEVIDLATEGLSE